MARLIRRFASAVALLGVSTTLVSGQALPTTVINNTFTRPVFAASAPGIANTLFVVQQGGQIRPLNTSTGAIGATVLNMSSFESTFLSGGERGLLGLAFHPDFATNGLFYTQYTRDNGTAGGSIRVDQFRYDTVTGTAGNRLTVIETDDRRFTNHNAGWIGFNPQAPGGSATAARYNLYIPTGDGGDANDPDNNAQNLSAATGKLLRINVGSAGVTATGLTTPTNPGGYTIPAGNRPATGTERPEIFSYGLRNPYRASFDRTTGNLYIGDVGQGAREEVNFIPNLTGGQPTTGGQNFGWRLREGTIPTPTSGIGGDRPPGNVDPIHEYTRDLGRSITGGNVYRGNARDTDGTPLDGTYFFGDYATGRLFSFRVNAAGTGVTDLKERNTDFGIALGARNFSSFAEDGEGNLYALTYDLTGNGTGSVIRLVPVPEPASIGACVGVGIAAVAGWRRLRRQST